MIAKAKKALLEAAVMVMAGIVITVMFFTQTGDIPAGDCFAICGVMMCAQAGCIWKGGTSLSLEEKRIDRLYKLLERVKDPDTKAALRWAIFELERMGKSE